MFVFSSRVIGATTYSCFLDFCKEGLQFCNLESRRCNFCHEYHQQCLTHVQQRNCTEYCMDQWIQNHEPRNNCDHFWMLVILLLSVLIILILVDIIFCRCSPIRRLSANVMKDVFKCLQSCMQSYFSSLFKDLGQTEITTSAPEGRIETQSLLNQNVILNQAFGPRSELEADGISHQDFIPEEMNNGRSRKQIGSGSSRNGRNIPAVQRVDSHHSAHSTSPKEIMVFNQSERNIKESPITSKEISNYEIDNDENERRSQHNTERQEDNQIKYGKPDLKTEQRPIFQGDAGANGHQIDEMKGRSRNRTSSNIIDDPCHLNIDQTNPCRELSVEQSGGPRGLRALFSSDLGYLSKDPNYSSSTHRKAS